MFKRSDQQTVTAPGSQAAEPFAEFHPDRVIDFRDGNADRVGLPQHQTAGVQVGTVSQSLGSRLDPFPCFEFDLRLVLQSQRHGIHRHSDQCRNIL